MEELEKVLGAKKEDIEVLINKISSPKVKRVIEIRYGLNGGNIKELDEVANEMKISMELARQFESRGLRFLENNLK